MPLFNQTQTDSKVFKQFYRNGKAEKILAKANSLSRLKLLLLLFCKKLFCEDLDKLQNPIC